MRLKNQVWGLKKMHSFKKPCWRKNKQVQIDHQLMLTLLQVWWTITWSFTSYAVTVCWRGSGSAGKDSPAGFFTLTSSKGQKLILLKEQHRCLSLDWLCHYPSWSSSKQVQNLKCQRHPWRAIYRWQESFWEASWFNWYWPHTVQIWIYKGKRFAPSPKV